MNIKICDDSQIKDNQTLKFDVPNPGFDREALLLRQNGQLLAYFNECPHIGMPLDWDDNDFLSSDHTKLVCKSHGAEFLTQTGECTAGPCPGAFLKPIKVTVTNNTVIAHIESKEEAKSS